MFSIPGECENEVIAVDQENSQSVDGGNCDGSLAVNAPPTKKGPWTQAEDAILIKYVQKHGEGNWNAVQKNTGLLRCGKSCRLRWANHLRPSLKKESFSKEEEDLIIQLHAQIGNKWAKMATYLPGRTDNEIKNYWNTRIKRRQRAGLPLYPPELNNQCVNESQATKNTNDLITGDNWQNELLQPHNFDIHDIVFPDYKPDPSSIALPFNFPDLGHRSILNPGFRSLNHGPIISGHPSKRLRQSEALMSGSSNPVCTLPGMLQYPIENFGSVKSRGSIFPFDPDPGSRNLPTMVGFPGSHAVPNGNFSASPFPAGKVKLELPSLQLQLLDSGVWSGFPTLPIPETSISSPTITDSLQSECGSIRDSGLLEAILHEAHVLGNLRDELPTWSSGSSIAAISGVVESSAPHDTEFDACDSISPMGCSAASVFSECTLKSGCSLEETPYDGINGRMKCQMEESSLISRTGSKRPRPVTYRPDALLAASCCSNEVSIYEKYVNDHEPLQSAPSTLSAEEHVPDSNIWNELLFLQNPEFHGD